MGLKKFNREMVQRSSNGIPYINIAKRGTIRLNKNASKLLGISVGDKINLYNDEERPQDWFIEKTHENDGLKMRKCYGGEVACNAAKITSEIISTLKISIDSVSMRIASNPVEEGSPMYAILTGSGKK